MSNMEELLNQTLVEQTRDGTVTLPIQKYDLDYAYGELKLSKQTSRKSVSAIIDAKFCVFYTRSSKAHFLRHKRHKNKLGTDLEEEDRELT